VHYHTAVLCKGREKIFKIHGLRDGGEPKYFAVEGRQLLHKRETGSPLRRIETKKIRTRQHGGRKERSTRGSGYR